MVGACNLGNLTYLAKIMSHAKQKNADSVAQYQPVHTRILIRGCTFLLSINTNLCYTIYNVDS